MENAGIKTRPTNKSKGWSQYPHWLRRFDGLTADAKNLYLFLEDLGKKKDAVFPRHETMAREIGKGGIGKGKGKIARNTLKSFLNELYTLKWVERIVDPKTNWVTYEVEPIENIEVDVEVKYDDRNKFVQILVKFVPYQSIDTPLDTPVSRLTPCLSTDEQGLVSPLTGIKKELEKKELKEREEKDFSEIPDSKNAILEGMQSKYPDLAKKYQSMLDNKGRGV